MAHVISLRSVVGPIERALAVVVGFIMTETTTVTGAALVVTLVAMWATRPPPACAMAPDPHRHLDLERGVDREHRARQVQRLSVAQFLNVRPPEPNGSR